MTMERKNFERPDDRTTFDHGFVDLVHTSQSTVGKAVLEPGWRWSDHVKPIVKTEWCEENHVGFIVSGRLHIRMSNGDELELGPGDVGIIPPGHDGWVVGNEPVVSIEWAGVKDFAKP
jgi:quercetin dioxygenase-like cupin family protein